MKKLLFILMILFVAKTNAQTYITKEPKGEITITDLNGFDIPSGIVSLDRKFIRKSGRIYFYKLQSICIECDSKDAAIAHVNPKKGNEFIMDMYKKGTIDSSFSLAPSSVNRIYLTLETENLVEVAFDNYYCVKINTDDKTIKAVQVIYVLEKKRLDSLLKEGKLESYLFTLPNYF